MPTPAASEAVTSAYETLAALAPCRAELDRLMTLLEAALGLADELDRRLAVAEHAGRRVPLAPKGGDKPGRSRGKPRRA